MFSLHILGLELDDDVLEVVVLSMIYNCGLCKIKCIDILQNTLQNN